MPDAASLRQEILEDLTDLFVTDGTGDFPDELDFYECRFNKAFMALRIDAVRRDVDLKPQLGRTEASAKDLKQQVELLRRDYREIAEVLRGV